MNKLIPILLLSSAAYVPSCAFAQRTADNAVTQSSDAFGKSVGNEKTGLYSAEDVRGFNPVDAGNARIEGLYFDQIDRLSNRTSESSTIHVGISAQHYPFPAPTGLVDYALVKPSEKLSASLDLESAPYDSVIGAAQLSIPIIDHELGVTLGLGSRSQNRPEGGNNFLLSMGLGALWHPYSGADIRSFYGQIDNKSEEARATIFTGGAYLPPEIPRTEFLGQKWTGKEATNMVMGAIAKLPMGEFRFETGLFRTTRNTPHIYSDLLIGVTPDGAAANRIIIADGNNRDDSISGEARLVREWSSHAFTHSITLSLRGREKERLFGGTQRISLGASSAIIADFRAAPVITLGAENQDKVHQITYGAAYSLNWAGKGSLDISLSKSAYRKQVIFTNSALPVVNSKDDPLLWNVAGSILLTHRLAIYGGYVRGLEEALIAPDIATNRSEAPPAIRTQQYELGMRYAITPKLSLVAGIFSIRKPYFNLDSSLRYRQLGDFENRGIEVSLAGQIRPGISLVAGMVFLSPKISGEAVTLGQIGDQPVGTVKRRATANLDWRLDEGKSDWSFDLAFEGTSSRIANAANTLSAPSRESINLGARYRFEMMGNKALLRPLIANLFNDYGWMVSSSGGFTYSNSRAFSVQLLVDI